MTHSQKSGTPKSTKPLSKTDADVEQTEDGEMVHPPSSPKPIVRRGRKRAAVMAEAGTTGTQANSVPPDAPTKPPRKSRTPKSQTRTPPAFETEPPPLPGTTEITRTVRMRSKAQDLETNGTKAANSTSGRKGVRVKVVEVDLDDDPLDSIGDTKAEQQAEAVVPAPKGRRGTRSRTVTADEVKEEVDAPTGGESRVTESKKPARTGGGSGTRTSARMKGTGSSPVTPTSDDGVDKENTPGTGGEEGLASLEKSTKVKVSRSRRAPVKDEKIVEENTGHEVVPVTTQTRVTRARARK
jgi:hypothetical protein